MKKKLGLMSLGILAILLFVSLTSAISFTDSVGDITLNPQDSSNTFTLIANGDANFAVTPVSFDLTDGTTIITVSVTEETINSNNVTYKIEATGSLDQFDFGESDSDSFEFSIENVSNSNDTATKTIDVTFNNNDFCEGLSNGDLKIEVSDVSVREGFGDDDDYWYLLDEIEIEVEVDNQANEDLEDLEVSWELYTTAGVKINSGDVDKFDLDENDDEKVTFTFLLDEDIEEFDGEDAVLYVKVEGEGDDTNNDYCGYDESLEVSMETGDNFVIAGNFKVDDREVEEAILLSCGQIVEVSAEIINLGDSDQDDVYVEVYSSSLGIDERFDFDEVQAFENEMISFKFEVPKDMEDRTYSLSFEVYDEDNDIFENDDDDKAKTIVVFEGEEDCEVEVPSIAADLIGEAKAGKGLVINATLTNNDDQTRMFLLEVQEYSSWADLNEIRPKFVELESGESAQVEIVLTADRDLENKDYQFNLVASTEGEEILVQAVAVTIESKSFGIDFSKTFENFDWKLWGIIALNVILLLAIIIVTVKIMKKK